jgi:alpha-glucosidase
MNRELAARSLKQSTENPDMADVLDGIQRKARDHGRSPMQWDASRHGGFSQAEPWMRVNDDYREWNVATQKDDEGSILSFWKAMLIFRKKYLACVSSGHVSVLIPDLRQLHSH